MFMTSWMLIIFATTSGNMHLLPDEHSPFETEATCEQHAAQSITELAPKFPQRTQFRYVCLPMELESI